MTFGRQTADVPSKPKKYATCRVPVEAEEVVTVATT
jgi:hypothetical protein